MSSTVFALCIAACQASNTEGATCVNVDTEYRIDQSAQRAISILKLLPLEGLDRMEPEVMALIRDSDAFVQEESRPSKHYALWLRQLIASSIVFQLEILHFQGEEDTGQAHTGVPQISPDLLMRVWRRIQVSEEAWLEACIAPETTIFRWSRANDIGAFLRDSTSVEPLPSRAREFLYGEGTNRGMFSNPEIKRIHGGDLGSSALFAEACFVLQSLRDKDVYVTFYLKHQRPPRSKEELLEMFGNDSKYTRLDERYPVDSEECARRVYLVSGGARLSSKHGGYGNLITSMLAGFVKDLESPVVKAGTLFVPDEYIGMYLRGEAYVFDEELYNRTPVGYVFRPEHFGMQICTIYDIPIDKRAKTNTLLGEWWEEFARIREKVLNSEQADVCDRLLIAGKRPAAEDAQGLRQAPPASAWARERDILRHVPSEMPNEGVRFGTDAPTGDAILFVPIPGTCDIATPGENEGHITITEDGDLAVFMRRIEGVWYWNPFALFRSPEDGQ